MTKYSLSKRSLSNLEGVHEDLVKVVKRAIELTPFDFGISEGLRTRARQEELMKQGASKTMHSRHVTGHAIDLYAYINGKAEWNDMSFYLAIAEAFAKAGRELGVPIRWGGSWTVINDEPDLKKAMNDYVARKRKEGQRALVDAVHFELPSSQYR